MVFLVIGIVGVAVLVVALVLGDIADLSGHVEFGGDAFSTASLAGFLAAFGFAAAIVDDLSSSLVLSLAVGVLVGTVVATALVMLTRALKRGGTAGTVSTAGLVGLEGKVVQAVPLDGFGQVSVRAHGQQLRLNARAEHPIPAGERIWVSAVISPTAVEVRDSDPLAGIALEPPSQP